VLPYGLFSFGRTKSSSFKHKKGLRPKGLPGMGKKDKKYCSLHFTRGLRHHRYFCVALRGFQEWGRRIKRYRSLHFTRGLRHHRYFCVALRGFQETGKMIKRYCSLHFTRGLRHHRYYSVALRAFFIRKDEVLVVQAQEEVGQEVTIAMSPYGLSNIEKRRRVCFPFFFKCITFRCQLVPFFIAIHKVYNVSNVLLLLRKKNIAGSLFISFLIAINLYWLIAYVL